jgi:putative DNA primase/helicase
LVQFTKPNPLSPEEAEAKTAIARKLWESAIPVADTIVAIYLAKRRLEHLVASTALRFHPAAPHPNGICLPAMVAQVSNVAGKLIGVQRLYLGLDGSKADVNPQRANLGLVVGGAIRLSEADPDKPLVIAEGTETAASAGRLSGLPAWGAVSCGNMATSLVLPIEVQEVLIAADNDDPGKRAARAAEKRWTKEGRKVSVFLPAGGHKDFNDLLCAKGKGGKHD